MLDDFEDDIELELGNAGELEWDELDGEDTGLEMENLVARVQAARRAGA